MKSTLEIIEIYTHLDTLVYTSDALIFFWDSFMKNWKEQKIEPALLNLIFIAN